MVASSMGFKLQPGEKVILVTLAQLDPPLFSSSEIGSLFITNKRMFFELNSPVSIPFDSVQKIDKKRWAIINSRITITYLEKGTKKEIEFTCRHFGVISDLKTKLVYDTINRIFKKQELDLKKLERPIEEEGQGHVLLFIFFVVLAVLYVITQMLIEWLTQNWVAVVIAIIVLSVVGLFVWRKYKRLTPNKSLLQVLFQGLEKKFKSEKDGAEGERAQR